MDKEQFMLACNMLEKAGCVVAVPTDTLYGIAARVDDTDGLERIYKIKGRDCKKPLAVCVSDTESIEKVGQTDSLFNKRVLDILFPGPITIILKRSLNLNPNLNPGVDTVGIRIPDHNFITALAKIVGPLALTSANRSGADNPIRVEDFQDLWDKLDCIFDCGALRIVGDNYDQLGSTVVDLSQGRKYRIIREGLGMNRAINVLNRLGFRMQK